MMKNQKAFIIQVLLILIVGSSCAISRPEGKTEAEVLYKEAQDFVERKRYLLATENLNTIRSKFPYSFYATYAELLQADIYFLQESYVEAASAYKLFYEFHPKHKKIDYVLWRVAESYYNQIPSTIDRDLTPAQNAIEYYQIILKRKNSKYQKMAVEKIQQCLNMLLDKEIYIADFYYRTEVFDAARYRYQYILDKIKIIFEDKTRLNHVIKRLILSQVGQKAYTECLNDIKKYNHLLLPDVQNEVKNLYNKCVKNN